MDPHFASFAHRLVLLPLLFAQILTEPALAQHDGSRPNVVFIVADDLGYADLSGYGRKEYRTPALDRLAREGTRFSQAYAAAPVCTPSRAAFMTGRYPARTTVGLWEPLLGREPPTGQEAARAVGLSPEHPTVSSRLRASGYETALVGKWHLGLLPDHHPNRHGFDEFFGILPGAADYVDHRPGLFHNAERVEREGYLTDLLTEQAVAFIARPRTRPFFLSVQYTAPHRPWQVPGDPAIPDTVDFRSGGSAEVYARMVRHLDEGVGAILAALEEHGLRESTLVIFTSDNGGERFSDMGPPITGRKMQLWEGGIRVPAVIRRPGVVPPGRMTDQVAITMDWTATILAAAGVEPDPAYALDGIDLLPICQGEAPVQSRTLAWRTFQRARQRALWSGDWKFLDDGQGEYLFNLGEDPTERRDLKVAHPERLAQSKTLYREWEAQMLPPVPLQ